MSAFTKRLRAALLVLGLTAIGSAMAEPTRDDGNELSHLLQKQTQTFSEASQMGDALTMGRLLDPAVVFTNETGNIASKQDLVDGAGPPPAGTPARHIEVTDWALHRQDANLATSTFIDKVTTAIEGQILTLRFQSTETWIKRPDGWKMIVSHTMNVQRPPQPIPLPSAMLGEYVGIYKLGGYSVAIRKLGEGLTSSVNGGAAVPLVAEIKDVLFTPTVPNVRKIFQRDAAGRVTGYINRRDGADIVFKKVT